MTVHPLYIARNSISVDIINVTTGKVTTVINTEMTDR